MELDLVLSPEDAADESFEAGGLGSPMGGKHQRDLSLSAKWASNKALALEYLTRQREAILWIESVLDRQLPRDLFEALKSGIVLRELLAKLYPEPSGQCMSPISRRYSLTMAPWKERENISIFLKHCKAMGLNDTFLFCTDDLYEGTNMVQVLFSIQHFMAFSREKSKYLFKPIAQESLTFSNQELEMALSKIEQAGVDVNTLLTSAPPSAAPSPSKPHGEASETVGDSPPSAAPSTSDSAEVESKGEFESKDEQEPAEDEYEMSGDDDDESVALSLLEQELNAHDNNVPGEEEAAVPDDSAPVDDVKEDANEVKEDVVEAAHDLVAESQLSDPDDVEAESRVEDVEKDEEDIVVSQELADSATEAEIFAFVAAELEQSIVLLEIMDEMLKSIEDSRAVVHATAAQSVSVTIPEEIEVVRLSSTELTDKNGTFVGDSLAPTVADTNAAADPQAPPNKFSRGARASKKASKTGKKKRESSDEPLDTEAMSKCTCGSKCTIM